MCADMAVTSATLSEALVKCVHDAIIGTCSSILGAAPAREPGAEVPHQGPALIGVISFTGSMTWTCMMGLPQATVCPVVEKFAGFPLEFEAPEMGDAVGELLNVIAGDMVARLDSAGIKAQMSLPTTARGNNVEMMLPAGIASRVLLYNSPLGSFWVKLATGKSDHTRAAGSPCPNCGRC